MAFSKYKSDIIDIIDKGNIFCLIANSHPPASSLLQYDNSQLGKVKASWNASHQHFCKLLHHWAVWHILRKVLSTLFCIHDLTDTLWLTGESMPLFGLREYGQFCCLGSKPYLVLNPGCLLLGFELYLLATGQILFHLFFFPCSFPLTLLKHTYPFLGTR